jgi:hypothetical protein
MRIAPKPSLVTGRLPPMRNWPDALAGWLVVVMIR